MKFRILLVLLIAALFNVFVYIIILNHTNYRFFLSPFILLAGVMLLFPLKYSGTLSLLTGFILDLHFFLVGPYLILFIFIVLGMWTLQRYVFRADSFGARSLVILAGITFLLFGMLAISGIQYGIDRVLASSIRPAYIAFHLLLLYFGSLVVYKIMQILKNQVYER